MQQNVIKRYIRNEKGNPRGLVIAVRKGDEVFYGYSLHNPIDKYDKERGFLVALARANAAVYKLPAVPERNEAVVAALKIVSDRAAKYFKDIPSENVKFEFSVTEEI